MIQEVKGWFVDYDHNGKVIGVASPDRNYDLELVASLRDEPTAHLLSAAPDLLEALEQVIEDLHGWAEYGSSASMHLYEDAKAAIAKAKGGAS